MTENENLDLKLISKIIETKDILTPKRLGIKSEILEGPGKALWDFIEGYWAKYQQLPSVTTCDQILLESKAKLYPAPEPIEFWAQEIVRRHLFDEIKEFQFKMDGWMNEKPPEEVIQEIQGFVNKQNESMSRQIQISSARDVLPEVIRAVEEASKGIMGIKTPFPTMDEMTGGWMPGDINFFVARAGVGKTWLATIVCDAALKQKKKVLYMSAEMTKKDIIMRHLSLDFKIHYKALRKGKMDTANKMKFAAAQKDYGISDLLHVVDASGGINTSAIESAIAITKPDLVIIDAAYRLKSVAKARDRNEGMAYVTTELKSIASRQQVPIVASTQLNRDSTKKKGNIGTEDLAMSDVLGWESTNVFAILQNNELKKINRLAIFPVKVREGENMGKDLIVKWDFYNMDFSEVGEFDIAHVKSADPLDQF